MGVVNRVAWVTGGAAGIGAEIVQHLAVNGAIVAISDVDVVAGTALASKIVANGGRVAYFQHDVTSWASTFATAEAIEVQLGPIAILVNNAGVSRRVPFLEMTEGEWDRLLDINLKGQFLTARAALPKMAERNYGRLINMSSICGKRGQPYFAHYCTSKFGIIGLTQSLAQEFAKTGITVNAVCPGIVATPLHNKIVEEMAAASGVSLEKALADFTSNIPQGRAQPPADIARMVIFLASDEATNMTGGSFHVDGGIAMD